PAPQAEAPPPPPAAPALAPPTEPLTVARAEPQEADSDQHFKDLRKAVFATRPALGVFKGIQEKAIRTREEAAIGLSIVSDPERITEARSDLTDARGQRGEERAMLRMYQIDLLTTALAWENHPHRADVLDSVDQIMRDASYRDQAGPTRASMNVDRAELFES